MNKEIAIAPMIGWTDRHFRYLLRLISPNTKVYTEMISADALIHNKHERKKLIFDEKEHPIALQLGGSTPETLRKAAIMGEEAKFDEINLNVGCPSPRVTKGAFGACLMLMPEKVAECVQAMSSAVNIPVTVKCRIGVDDHDQYDFLKSFVEIVSISCHKFIIHARKAWLKGLSPKQNRTLPPLCYETVAQIKKDFPKLTIIINGGFNDVASMNTYLNVVDGCMIGRVVCNNPFFLAEVEKVFFNYNSPTRKEIVMHFLQYMDTQQKTGIKLAKMARYLLNLFHGERGAQEWRRYLSAHMHQENSSIDLIEKGLIIY